ncbi:MAG: bifunctional riboflavin kinase/FAD synthetase [Proteobacteria bacterium]|nr:bifunctional riboflavin kinase/FAD synthetase [Pseudomonadota bacterium]
MSGWTAALKNASPDFIAVHIAVMSLLHNNSSRIPAAAEGSVLAIGNFDGVHLGHRALIEKARDLARQNGRPLGVMTFEPHPRQFFQPEAEPFRLTPLSMKQRLLHDLGVNHLFVCEFNQAFSQLDETDFIEQILLRKFKASHVVVGADFAFGHQRAGTVETLAVAAAVGKFKLSVVPAVISRDGQVYSSTAIRNLLCQGKFAEAEKCLGWPWQIEAPIVHGDKRGRTLGYPTANQNIPEYVRIPFGIYAVKALIEGEDTWHDAVANFGIRPMFRVSQPIFETFIFDFSSDIYGKKMRVMPIQHLRPERVFDDLPTLIAQMKEDCIAAKAVLKSTQAS